MGSAVTRVAIVGATSLLGKELAEQIGEVTSVQWDVHLFDNEEVAGQVTAAADEPLIIQPLTADSFSGVDVVFFAGDPSSAKEYWRNAVESGANVVDLSGGLEGEENVSVRSPLVLSSGSRMRLDLSAHAVVSAHPAAIMLGAVLARLQAPFSPFLASATVLEPSSQLGSAGMDEMHAQTVSLLSFKPLPQEVYDSQVAFNLSSDLGSDSRSDLAMVTKTIRRHLDLIAGNPVAAATAIQSVQAPVFSGYTASVFVTTASSLAHSDIERVLNGDGIEVRSADDPSPSNQSATQQGQILVRISASENAGEPKGFWLWMAADNLRLAARNAIACATEFLALRPGGRVQ